MNLHSPNQIRPRRAVLPVVGVALAVISTLVVGGDPARAAGTPSLVKEASVQTASPGDSFSYQLIPSCSGLQEGCVDAVLTDVLPPDVDVTSVPTSTAEYDVVFDPATRTLTVTFLVPLPSPPNPAGSIGLTAGSSFDLDVGVRIPPESQILDGALISNTATLSAAGSPPVSASDDVTVTVPRVVDPVATKSWADGSAVAGSGETGTMTLGVRNASSSTAQVSSLTLEDTTPAVFDRFDVTGVGPVVFPEGADRVAVLACTQPLSACADGDFVSGAAQAGPTLSLPVAADTVTGLRFVFTNAVGAVLPYGPTGGSVRVGTKLRDTLRSTGDSYRPSTRDRVENCVIPSAADPVLGAVAGTNACTTYDVEPAQATIGATKSFFSDTNGNYAPDGSAVVTLNSPVSALTTITNTSSFPLSSVTITEPDPNAVNEFGKLDVGSIRLVFPAGATAATLVVSCNGTAQPPRNFTSTPSTLDTDPGCGAGVRPTSVTVTYVGTDAGGNATIAQGAVARLGVSGRLNSLVDDSDVTVGNNGAGVRNCAAGAATSSINGVGAAAAGACDTLAVKAAFSNLRGTKSSDLPTILPGFPRRFTLGFDNNGTVPATNVVLADPLDPRAPGNSFDTVRLASLDVPATPLATVELFDPTAAGGVGGYVAFAATDAALLERARGFRIVVPTLVAGARYDIGFDVILRDGVAAGTTFQNCAAVGSDARPPTSFCAPVNNVIEPSSGAAIQKSTSPATSVRPLPGLPAATVQLKLAVQNTGTQFLRRLVAVDADPTFYDAVDLTGLIRVNYPPGADRVRVDTCGAPCTAESDYALGVVTGSQTPSLPGALPLDDVRGIRVTFSAVPVATPTNPSDEYRIRPGTNLPTTGQCTGASVCIGFRPRVELRSAPGTAVPDVLTNVASGGYESRAQTPGTLAPIPATQATHELTDGTALLSFSKTPDSTVRPGEGIPIFLTARNRGTGPITGLTIIEPWPAQLEFSPLDLADPYDIAYTLPAGAPKPSDVVLTPVFDADGRVLSLRWDFPDWSFLPGSVVTVGIRATLAPGAVAGQAIENRAGASSDRADVACEPRGTSRPSTLVDDARFGPGTYCTSAASVNTLAGNAIRTNKWVAGNPDLGFLNTVTGEIVDVDNLECPRRTVDRQQFTRYPCVARVEPGRAFDYYLEAVNAGTNPATQLRFVDVFPRSGDTGVILTGEVRGTEWDQPPTLLGPVTILGPGALSVDYTDAIGAVCTTELDRPPTACQPADWPLDAYDPSATAFKATIDLSAAPLAPGATTGMRFRMVAPANPTGRDQDEVAWNSFAHTEFFRQGQTTVQLPPTEPIKTGVALLYGRLSIQKEVVGDDPGSTVRFGISYECTVTPDAPGGGLGTPVVVDSGSVTLPGGQRADVDDVPSGASCAVWETDTAGYDSNADGRVNAVVVTIDGTTTTAQLVTVVNTATTTTTTTPPTTTTIPSSTTTIAPDPTGPTTTVDQGVIAPTVPPGGELPSTGSAIAPWLITALTAVCIGALALIARRRAPSAGRGRR